MISPPPLTVRPSKRMKHHWAAKLGYRYGASEEGGARQNKAPQSSPMSTPRSNYFLALVIANWRRSRCRGASACR